MELFFLQTQKKERNIPGDENNHGGEKIALLVKIIQYFKQYQCRCKTKDTDLSAIVLNSFDFTPKLTAAKENTDSKKIQYKITLRDVSNRQQYRKAQDISSVIASEAEKQQETRN